MFKPKIFISTYPFGSYNTAPLDVLEKTGWELSINELKRKLTPIEVAELAKNVDGIIAGTEDLSLLINNNPKLKFISRVGIGLDSVPLSLCKEKGISVSYTPDAVTMAVVEFTLGLILNVSRHIHLADKKIRNGDWSRFIGKRLGESTIGILGCGRVGSNVVRLLTGFHPKKILINDVVDKTDFINGISKDSDIKFVSKDEIYENSDIVSIHLPLNKKTKNLITLETLKKFNKDSFLINTARGGIVNENDLYYALQNKIISGAAVDVFEQEPYFGKLSELDNIILTEHMASCSFDCRLRMELEAAEELIRFFRKEPLQSEVPHEEYNNIR